MDYGILVMMCLFKTKDTQGDQVSLMICVQSALLCC